MLGYLYVLNDRIEFVVLSLVFVLYWGLVEVVFFWKLKFLLVKINVLKLGSISFINEIFVVYWDGLICFDYLEYNVCILVFGYCIKYMLLVCIYSVIELISL